MSEEKLSPDSVTKRASEAKAASKPTKRSRASKAPLPEESSTKEKQLVLRKDGIVSNRPKKYKSKVDVDKALKLKLENGLTYKQVADLMDVTPNAIYKQIAHLLPDDETTVYKNKRGDILAKLQKELLKSISADDIKDMPVGQRLMGYGILFDKERLERNQSTQIVGYDARAIEERLKQIQDMTDVIDAEMVESGDKQ